jgi:hypothetical protein
MKIPADLARPALLAAALLACKTRETTEPPLPLCPPLQIAAPTGEQPKPAVWLTLLLPDYDPETKRAPNPMRTCANQPVAPPVDPCSAAAPAPTPIATLDDHALVFADAGDGFLLLWAKTHRSPSGDALGPVALVEHSPHTLAVRALGMLEAPPNGTVLSLLTAGELRYLVAEGERCPDATPDATPAACLREARVLPLDGPAFVPSAYYDARKRCLESPRIPLFHRSPVPGNADRSVVDRRLIAVDAKGLVFQEELEFFAGDQLLRRSAETRRVIYEHGHLVVDAPSLWSRLAAHTPAPESPT